MQSGLSASRVFSRRVLRASLLSLAAMAAWPASATAATDSAWYLGSGVGRSQVQMRTSGFSIDRGQYPNQVTRGTGFKIYGGYRFLPGLALEAQYLTLGRYSLHSADGKRGASVRVSGIGLSAVGMLPLGDSFSLLGKLGLTQARLQLHDYDERDDKRFTKTRTTSLLGVGAEYLLTPQLALRAEYEYFGAPGFATSSTTSVKFRSEMVSLGLRYQF